MIADHALVDDIVALVGAVLIFIPAFIVAINQTRKVGKKVDEAASKAEVAVEQAQVVADRTDTGNGKTIGETAHDTNQTVELLAAMMHTNTKETIALSNKLDAHIDDSVEYRKEAREVHDKLFEMLDELNGKGD